MAMKVEAKHDVAVFKKQAVVAHFNIFQHLRG
jgi:hypothetical protein